MFNLDQKATNKLIVALIIGVFLATACALSGWLVAFAAGYSHNLAAKSTTEVQTDLDRCQKDLEEVEDIAAECLDESSSSFLDTDYDSSYEDEEICGTRQGDKTVFDDERLQVFFETPASVDCVDLSSYSGSENQYIYLSVGGQYLSITLTSFGFEDYYADSPGFTQLEKSTVDTSDGFPIDITTYSYEYDDYVYYTVSAANQAQDQDLGLQITGAAYDEESAIKLVEIVAELVASIKFNKARG